MGDPNPSKGNYDPGVRDQIFAPTVRTKDGYYALDMSFVTANAQIKCDASWSTDIYDTYKKYLDQKNQSPSASQFSIKLPSLFSRSWEKEEGINNIKELFVKEKGSI